MNVVMNKNNKLPLDWELTEIKNISEVNPRSDKSVIRDNLEVSFVPMPAVSAGNGFIDVTQNRPFSEVKKGYTGFLEGDVLFAKITPCMENGKMAVVPKLINGYGFGSTEFHVLRPKQVESKYLYFFVSAEVFRRNAAHHMTGAVGQKRVPTVYIKECKIPVAPPNEQKRIVAEIEKQFSRLDEAVDNLRRIKANLKRYKASVLKAAVEGKLTEEWRKKNLPAPSSKPGKFYTYAILCDNDSIYIGHTDDIVRRWKQHLEGKGAEWTTKHKPVKIVHWEEFDIRKEAAEREKWLKTGYGRKWLKRECAAERTRQAGQVEPADKLLEHILAKRCKKWEEAELAKMRTAGKKPKDDKWKKKYKEPNPPNIDGLPKFPDSWTFVRIEQILPVKKDAMKTGPFGTLLKKHEHRQRGIQVLGIENIQAMKFVFGSKIHIDSDKAKELVGYRTISGDILVSRSGTVGEVCVVPKNIGAARISTNLMKLSLEKDGMLPQFFTFLFNGSPFILNQVSELCKGSTRNFLNQDILKKIVFILPPLKEQRIIIQEVENKLSIIDGIEKEVKKNLIRAGRLRQSILKRAFSGLLFQSNRSMAEHT